MFLRIGKGVTLAAAVAVLCVVVVPTRAEEPPAKPAPTWDQRLGIFPINDHVVRGALPEATDCAKLAQEKGVKRIISLLPENEVPADVKQAADAAGIKYEFHPIAEGGEGADRHTDRAEVAAVVDELRSAGGGTTYLHCKSGRNLNAVVDFAYQVKVDDKPYVEALLEVFKRGMQAPQNPGLVQDLKLIASGLDALPVVPVMPLSDSELLGRGKRVNAGGVRLHVKSMGEGPAVYVLHGGPGESHIMFRPYLDALAKDHTLVYYDQRGCGYSERPPFREAYTIERNVADLDALREALGHDKITLLGQSTGGALAVSYALAHPEHVDKLVIVSSWASAEEFTRTQNVANGMLTADDIAKLRELSMPLAAQRRDPNDDELSAMQEVVYPTQFFGALTPEFKKDWSRRARVSSLVAQAMNMQYMGPPGAPGRLDLRPRLGELKGIPTLVIAGQFDVVAPVETVRTYAQGIPDARFEIIPNAGHYVFVEQNAKFLEAVQPFLTAQPQ